MFALCMRNIPKVPLTPCTYDFWYVHATIIWSYLGRIKLLYLYDILNAYLLIKFVRSFEWLMELVKIPIKIMIVKVNHALEPKHCISHLKLFYILKFSLEVANMN